MHNVYTEDGFVLGLHRILYPFKRKVDERKSIRPPVLLVHGAGQTAFDWIANNVNNSLGKLRETYNILSCILKRTVLYRLAADTDSSFSSVANARHRHHRH